MTADTPSQRIGAWARERVRLRLRVCVRTSVCVLAEGGRECGRECRREGVQEGGREVRAGVCVYTCVHALLCVQVLWRPSGCSGSESREHGTRAPPPAVRMLGSALGGLARLIVFGQNGSSFSNRNGFIRAATHPTSRTRSATGSSRHTLRRPPTRQCRPYSIPPPRPAPPRPAPPRPGVLPLARSRTHNRHNTAGRTVIPTDTRTRGRAGAEHPRVHIVDLRLRVSERCATRSPP